MAFVQATLQSDLLSVFQSMTDGDDSVFSDGVAQALKNFVNSGTPSTTDAGTIPTGAFTGASTGGTITADDSACAQIIASAFTFMRNNENGGDDYLADKIAEGLQRMTDDAVVTTSVSGTTVPPSPPPPTIPTAGTAKGGITCVTTAVASGLKAVFSAMKEMSSGGDAYFASQMASLVNACLLAGVVSTQGQGNLAGSTGTGTAT